MPELTDFSDRTPANSNATSLPSLRRLDSRDSLDELTALLHRAFAPLGVMGLNCTGINQSVDVTGRRIAGGECFVALSEGRVVGTLTLYAPDAGSASAWYHRPEVASIHQFAVDPPFQGKGVGKALLKLAETWAAARGYRELALETPHAAKHLVDLYKGCGYRPIESVRFQDKSYVSLVLSKAVVASAISRAGRPTLHLPRRRADTTHTAVAHGERAAA